MTVDVLTLSATPIPHAPPVDAGPARHLRPHHGAGRPRASSPRSSPQRPARAAGDRANSRAAGSATSSTTASRHRLRGRRDQNSRCDARIVVGHGQIRPRARRVMPVHAGRVGRRPTSSSRPRSSGRASTSRRRTRCSSTTPTSSAWPTTCTEAARTRRAQQSTAYCYMLLDPERHIPAKSVKRLKAIEEFSMLGAGSDRDATWRSRGRATSSDLSRAGIAAVPDTDVLPAADRAVKGTQAKRTETASETTIEIGVWGSSPRPTSPRTSAHGGYRRIPAAERRRGVRVETELRQAYGPFPGGGVDRLLQLCDAPRRVLGVGVQPVGLPRKRTCCCGCGARTLRRSPRCSRRPPGRGYFEFRHEQRPRQERWCGRVKRCGRRRRRRRRGAVVTLLPPAATDTDKGPLLKSTTARPQLPTSRSLCSRCFVHGSRRPAESR